MKTGRMGGLLAGALAAAIMLPFSAPALADTAADAPEPQLEAQDGDYSDITISINCPDDYGSPYADDEAYESSFSCDSFDHDTVRWSVFAGQLSEDGEATKLSADLATDCLTPSGDQGSEGTGLVNVKKIYDEHLSEVDNPCIVVGVELLKGGEVIASEEHAYKIQRPYKYVTNGFSDQGISTLIVGNDVWNDGSIQFLVYNATHLWDGFNVDARIISATSADESIVAALMDQEDGSITVKPLSPGTTTVTFAYECAEYPQYNGTITSTFKVANQQYWLDFQSKEGRFVLPGADLTFDVILRNEKKVGEDIVSFDTLEEGDTIECVLDGEAPEGTEILSDPDDPLHFTLHVPETAPEYTDIYGTIRIMRDGQEVCASNQCLATVSTSYYTRIKLVDAATNEELGDAIELKVGESITVAPKVYEVTAEGTSEVTDLPWQVEGTEGCLKVEPTSDGAYTLTLLGTEADEISFRVSYDTENYWDNTMLLINPFSCGQHEWETTLESIPTDGEPGQLVKRCQVCGEVERNNVYPAVGGTSYLAESDGAFFNSFGLLFRNLLGHIEDASPADMVTFTMSFYNIYSEEWGPVHVSYQGFVDQVCSLFAAAQPEDIEGYLEGQGHIFADKAQDALVLPTGGGFGDPDYLRIPRIETTATGRILHGQWMNYIEEDQVTGTEGVDYIVNTHEEDGQTYKSYFTFGQKVRLVLNGTHQVVAYEEDTASDLAEVAELAGVDKILLYNPDGDANAAAFFRPRLKDGDYLDPETDYVVSKCDFDAESQTVNVEVRGVGNYCGELTATMRTAPVKVTVADVPFNKLYSPNNRDTVYETVTAVVDGEEQVLERDADYKISFEGDLLIGYDKPVFITGVGVYAGFVTDAATYRTVGDMRQAAVSVGALTFTNKALTPKVTVSLPGGEGKYYFWNMPLEEGRDYRVSIKNSAGAAVATLKDAGTYTAVITGEGLYTQSKSVSFTVAKAANPLKATGKTATVKFAKVKKANQTITLKKAIKVSGAQGKLTYKKSSGNSKITINKTTGKITVKKGLKKGTYKVKVKVAAAETANYKKGTKTVTVTIKVK